MSAPRMQPSGFTDVVSTARMEGKIKLFGYGMHEDLPNPGDLLIISTNYAVEGRTKIETQFKLHIRGRDMHLFVEAAQEALLMWQDNKHWLQASASQPGTDTRPMTTIRRADNNDTLKRYLSTESLRQK